MRNSVKVRNNLTEGYHPCSALTSHSVVERVRGGLGLGKRYISWKIQVTKNGLYDYYNVRGAQDHL